MKLRGKRYDTYEPVEVDICDGLVTSIKRMEGEAAGLPWLSPGWIDLQVNGFNGFDFNGETTSVMDVAGITDALLMKGVTGYLPTVITGSYDRIRQAMTAISDACGQYPHVNRSVLGIHLEGPYISAEDGPRGAHDIAYVRDPDWQEFIEWQEASGNRIRLVTVAPERRGAISFIKKLKQAGVAVSIGHTNANPVEIELAVEAGATLSTHLGNAAHPFLPRHPNYIWDQLAEDRLCATFIADGHHLRAPVLKAMLRAKRDKFILVSDSVKFGGMKPGRYSSVIGSMVELHPDGKLTPVENPLILAGSAQALDVGVANAVCLAGITLTEAVEAVTARPAQALGLPETCWLQQGNMANFTLFKSPDEAGTLQVVTTVIGERSLGGEGTI
jgi:N-acetylglucosamine-6-phosphate deacetylase